MTAESGWTGGKARWGGDPAKLAHEHTIPPTPPVAPADFRKDYTRLSFFKQKWEGGVLVGWAASVVSRGAFGMWQGQHQASRRARDWDKSRVAVQGSIQTPFHQHLSISPTSSFPPPPPFQVPQRAAHGSHSHGHAPGAA